MIRCDHPTAKVLVGEGLLPGLQLSTGVGPCRGVSQPGTIFSFQCNIHCWQRRWWRWGRRW